VRKIIIGTFHFWAAASRRENVKRRRIKQTPAKRKKREKRRRRRMRDRPDQTELRAFTQLEAAKGKNILWQIKSEALEMTKHHMNKEQTDDMRNEKDLGSRFYSFLPIFPLSLSPISLQSTE
jgi:hypothetical protein